MTVNGASYFYSGEFNSSEIPEDAYSVRVEYYPVNILTSGMFAHLSRCRYLTLFQTNVSDIELEAWLGLDQLETLHLGHNEMTTLRAGMFNHLSSIERISFPANKITSIHPQAFGNLTSLTWLNLRINHIRLIQTNTFMYLSHLESLDLSGNELDTIVDGTFNGLHSLKHLTLALNDLDDSIFTRANVFASVADTLESLYLVPNQISTIYNDMFSRFNLLESLAIAARNIEMPNGFRGLNSLNYLRLIGIQFDEIISSMWGEIGDTLTILSLYQSNIDSLTENMFARTPLLKKLHLGFNRIATIHAGAFNTLNSLENLDFQTNRITEEQIKNIQSVQQTLKELQLLNNWITNIPKDTFQNFTLLQYLGLSHNRISKLISGGFYGLQSLIYLRLDSNAISTIEHGSFIGLSSLRYLHLEDNQLTTLEWTAFGVDCMRPPGKYVILL